MRDYFDDSLLYCLDDGAALLEGPAVGEERTAILSEQEAGVARSPLPQSPTRNVPIAQASEAAPGGALYKRLWVAPSLVLIAVLGIYFGYQYLKPATTGKISSVAVLPFENRSGNADTDYLSDGLADSLIYRLSQIPGLKISPTTSVMKYRGRETDITQIAKELGVEAIMSGRLLQRGDDLAISVQLVDSRTEKLIWAEQYDRKMADLLGTQREIALTIAQKLQLELSGNEKGLLKAYTNSSEAYQLYLRGRYHWDKRTRADIERAIEYFEQAIEQDPNFALAYVGIADASNSMPGLHLASPKEKIPAAKVAAERALKIDPTLAEGHAARATSHALYDFDWPEVEREFLRALELNPNVAQTHYRYAIDFLIPMGRVEEAIRELERAVELEPINLAINANLAGAYLISGQYERGLEKARKTHELDPAFGTARGWLASAYNANGMYDKAIAICADSVANTPRGLGCLSSTGYAYAKAGRRREAEEVIKQFYEIERTQYVSFLLLASIYTALGSTDEAFAALDRSIEQRDFAIARLKVDPRFDALRGDARYRALLKRLNLPE